MQERLHSVDMVSNCLLNTHLQYLVEQRHAFELVVRSFPANPAKQALFYGRLVALLGTAEHRQPLAANSVLLHHVSREVQRVLRNGEPVFEPNQELTSRSIQTCMGTSEPASLMGQCD